MHNPSVFPSTTITRIKLSLKPLLGNGSATKKFGKPHTHFNFNVQNHSTFRENPRLTTTNKTTIVETIDYN